MSLKELTKIVTDEAESNAKQFLERFGLKYALEGNAEAKRQIIDGMIEEHYKKRCGFIQQYEQFLETEKDSKIREMCEKLIANSKEALHCLIQEYENLNELNFREGLETIKW